MEVTAKQLLPVDKNCYYTAAGLYDCEVSYLHLKGDLVKATVRLSSRRDASRAVRVLTVIATRQAIEDNRLSLVMTIHEWALASQEEEEYLVKEVTI